MSSSSPRHCKSCTRGSRFPYEHPVRCRLLAALAAAGHLSKEDYDLLTNDFRFLRNVEALAADEHGRAHDVPDEPRSGQARATLHYADPDALCADLDRVTGELRRVFDRIVGQKSLSLKSA